MQLLADRMGTVLSAICRQSGQVLRALLGLTRVHFYNHLSSAPSRRVSDSLLRKVVYSGKGAAAAAQSKPDQRQHQGGALVGGAGWHGSSVLWKFFLVVCRALAPLALVISVWQTSVQDAVKDSASYERPDTHLMPSILE